MNTKIKWVDNAMFVAKSGSGHSVVMDGPEDFGGQNLGVRPMEMVLMGLGGCTAFDVLLILKKGRHNVTDCEVEITAERSESVPKVYTKIHVHFVVTGRGLTEKAVARAVELSSTKYCSVSIMLGHSVEMSHGFEVVEEAV
ncbi:MAG: OsmC family protein [Methylococcales bacterium]|jgi:putative redox protein|nr:OsmC family protein [Methylococcales bacterium]